MPDPTEVLTDWKAKTDAATEGPWAKYMDPLSEGVVYEVASGPATEGYNLSGGDVDTCEGLTEEDADFIAVSRTAVPKLLAAVESVLGLHTAAFIYPLDDDGVPDQGKEPITTFCEECTCEDTIRDIENWEWNEDRDTVLWPCATVRAIESALGGGDHE